MSAPPQPDPYKVLGVRKDADAKAVKKAYMKLVLTCHPDKVKDAALKDVKQDEFQKVQEAYETLIDESKRLEYDQRQLRKETGRAGPDGGPSVFDYEIRTAEPRSASFRSSPKASTAFYKQPSTGSYEEEFRPSSFDDAPRARARKTASYEERKRPSTRDGERSRRSEEDREQERWTKEATRSRHEASKKTRDKERRRGVDEKYHRAHVEDDDSEGPYQARTRAVAEDFRDKLRGKTRSTEDPLIIRTNKVDAWGSFAADYIHASHRKARPDYDARPKAVGRAETYQEQPAYTIRYAEPPSPYRDEDSPRRSSAARSSSRRGSEQIPIRTREQPRSSSERERKGSAASYDQDRYVNIVEAAPQAPPAPSIKKPTLQSYTSAPPLTPNASSSRREPSRSQTLQPDYVRRDSGTVPPPLPRASTFQSFDKVKSASKGSSKLKKSYVSEESEPEEYSSRRDSPPRRREPAEPKRYVYDEAQSRTIPIHRYRDVLRDDAHSSPRERSVSPRGGSRRSAERPSLRATSSSGPHAFSRSSPHYFSSSASPEPIIKEAGRPRMAGRGSSSHSGGGLFGEVKRGSDPNFASYPVRA